MESVKRLQLNRQDEFTILYNNPEGARYYQDGMFFGVGGRYLEKHIPFNLLPKDVQAKVRKRGGLRPIMTPEDIAKQSVDFRRLQADKEAFEKEKQAQAAKLENERAELEKLRAEVEAMKGKVETPKVETPEPLDTKAEEKTEEPEEEEYICQHEGCGKKYKSKKYFDKHLKTHEET